jgi:uncharacterized protein
MSEIVARADVGIEPHCAAIHRTNLPVVNEGDALFHIAQSKHRRREQAFDEIAAQLESDPWFDKDENI